MNLEKNKPVILWLLSGCLLILIMVIIGGITRLTHSGLSMVEWHLFMGAIPPMNDTDWQAMFVKYQQFPEFKELNYDFTLQDFKQIFFWEYLHRLIGRLIGILFIVPFCWFWYKKMLSKKQIGQYAILFTMGGFQGFLGWYMVKSGLIKDPHVSHYRLALHLITAFLTFAYSFWLLLDLIYETDKPKIHLPIISKLSWILLPMVIIQIIYGAFVAGLRAGTVYNTFPKMGEKWIAEGVTALEPLYTNFLTGLAGVQFIHRYLAYVVAGLVIFTWFKGIRLTMNQSQLLALRGIFYAVVLQFTLGVFTLLNAVPISLGVAHQVGAFILLGTNIMLVHRFKFRS